MVVRCIELETALFLGKSRKLLCLPNEQNIDKLQIGQILLFIYKSTAKLHGYSDNRTNGYDIFI